MEWVQTTGPTIEAALDAALDQLGVDEDDVEFEVLETPKAGLFGRIGGHPARIRARVKPISREKPGERNRSRSRQGRRNGGGRGGSGGGGRGPRPAGKPTQGAPTPDTGESGAGSTSEGRGETSAQAKKDSGTRRRGRGGSGGVGGSGGSGTTESSERSDQPQKGNDVTIEDVPIGEQADVADEFMRGLVAAFGVAADVAVRIDDDVVLVDVEGEDLGLLVGPKGATLRAIEDLVRTVVQRRTDGHGARIHVDIAGYQAKRRAALERFARDLAQRVLDEGQELALEPMPPADRKVVHDAVAAIEGVETTSEGEEPRRRVVLRPA